MRYGVDCYSLVRLCAVVYIFTVALYFILRLVALRMGIGSIIPGSSIKRHWTRFSVAPG